jgi:REP element-mobilizing transposase RayT
MANRRQLKFRFRTWGGRRANAGRKQKLPGPRRVSHRARPRLASRFPVHVTTRIRDDLPRLRHRKRCKVIRAVMLAVLDQPGFRICEFSVQKSHLHLVCEAASTEALARGMKRFKHMVARGLNRLLRRKGSVFLDRYHLEILRTPQQVRNALCYVIQNARRHQVSIPTFAGGVDPYSSAWWFDGWKDQSWRSGVSPPADGEACVSAAGTWLLSVGWRRAGLIGPAEVPAAGRTCGRSRLH